MVLVLHEANIGKFGGAGSALKTLRMPVVRHCFNDTTNYELTTALAARGVQDVEVSFTVFAASILVVDAVLELAEALRAAVKRKEEIKTKFRLESRLKQ